jgi:hypothetical protein
MTATAPTTELQAAPQVVQRLVDWFETTHVPDGLFTEDVFLDFTPPQWRLQAQGVEGAVAIRRAGHPLPGQVRRLRYDPTPDGFVLEWEEEWDDAAGHWYCREMMRAELRDGAISSMSVYCTGDWDETRVARHAREVALLRP